MPPSEPPDHRDHLRWVRENQIRVLGHEPSVREALMFLAGFDAATGYALFRDLDTWLVVKHHGEGNVHWRGLLAAAALGLDDSERIERRDSRPEPEAVDRVLGLVLEFLDEIDQLDVRIALYRDRDGSPS